MTVIRIPLLARIGGLRPGSLRFGRRVPRVLSVVVASTVGLVAVQGAAVAPLDDEAERDERIVFRHFL